MIYKVSKNVFGYQNGPSEFEINCELPFYIVNNNYRVDLSRIEISGVGNIIIDHSVEIYIRNYFCIIKVPLNGTSGTIRYTSIDFAIEFL